MRIACLANSNIAAMQRDYNNARGVLLGAVWNALDRLIQATATLLADLAVQFHATDGGPTFRPTHNVCQPA